MRISICRFPRLWCKPWVIVLLAIFILLANMGLQIKSFANVLSFKLQGNISNRIYDKTRLRPIAYELKKINKRTVLNTPIYFPRKIHFEDAFPPNIAKASTLNTKFVIENSDKCHDTERIDYIVVVHSAVNNFDRRQSIRSTWARENVIHGVSSRTVFLTGHTEDMIVQDKLLRENDYYGDIVQGEFMDTYHNLTLKNVMGLRWVSTYCSNAKFVIKVDDDVFVNIFRARDRYFTNLEKIPKQLICKVGPKNIIFRKYFVKHIPNLKKWGVARGYFNGSVTYPMPYCWGFAVFMSTEMVTELYRTAQVTPAYPLDDVYVYGILASMIKNSSWRDEVESFGDIKWTESETLSNWGCTHKRPLTPGMFESATTAQKRPFALDKRPLILGTFESAATAQHLWDMTLNCLPNRNSIID